MTQLTIQQAFETALQHHQAGRLPQAEQLYRQILAHQPHYPEVLCMLGVFAAQVGQLDSAVGLLRQALALRPNYTDADGNLVYTLHFHPGYDTQAIAEEHRRWNRQHAEPLKRFIQPHANDRNPDRRLRIGYVSPDLREHPVGRFLLPLLSHHDKSQVEVFAYAQVPVSDALTRRLRAHVDVWRNIMGLSDAQVAGQIRQDRIDILIDLAMHLANNRLLVFAHKPAPVQVTYLAYCASTGLSAIDYRLSDPYLDPPGMDESIYSERTIRLPQTYWCYQPMVDLPPQPSPGLGSGRITFGCLNNFCKINDAMLAIWARVLQAVPASQLLLHAHEGDHRQEVRKQLEQAGIEPQRVQFAERVPMPEYLKIYHSIDVALDTFPYGGGTTSCDALWMGVPVVSLVGQRAVSRAGLSILSNVGLPELVASSGEEYVQIAANLANDPARLSDLRSTLRQRMERSPLMDAPAFARNIEAAYRRMWQSWCARL